MSAPSPATQPSAKWRLAAPRRPLRGHWPRPRDCNVAASAQSSAFLYFILSLFIGPFFLQGVLDRHRETERVSLTVCFFYFLYQLVYLGWVVFAPAKGPGKLHYCPLCRLIKPPSAALIDVWWWSWRPPGTPLRLYLLASGKSALLFDQCLDDRR